MKTSQKSLLLFAGAVLFGVFLLLAGTRLVLSNYVVEGDGASPSENADGSPTASRIMPMDQLTEFNEIDVSGTAELTIRQGDHWSVEIKVEPGKQDMISSYVEDGRLVLASSNQKAQKGWQWFSDNGVPFSAEITMPSLKQLSASGRTSISLESFSESQLRVDLAGTSSLEGKQSKIVDLKLVASGANSIDLSDVNVTNADIMGAGANNIVLHMAGGSLSGTVSGVGNVEYSGSVAKKNIQLSGMAQLTEK